MILSAEQLHGLIASIRDRQIAVVEAIGPRAVSLNLTPGEQVLAEVIARLPTGQSLANIAGQTFSLPLPPSVNPGETLRLTFLGNEPHLTFALSQGERQGATATVSDTARWLGQITREPQLPHSPLPRASQLLISPPTEPRVIIPQLQQAVAQSGLFYESHLAEWATGERSLAKVLTEPQGSLSQPAAFQRAAQPAPGPPPTAATNFTAPLATSMMAAEPAATVSQPSTGPLPPPATPINTENYTPTTQPPPGTTAPSQPTATPSQPTATPSQPTATPLQPTATPLQPTATPTEPNPAASGTASTLRLEITQRPAPAVATASAQPPQAQGTAALPPPQQTLPQADSAPPHESHTPPTLSPAVPPEKAAPPLRNEQPAEPRLPLPGATAPRPHEPALHSDLAPPSATMKEHAEPHRTAGTSNASAGTSQLPEPADPRTVPLIREQLEMLQTRTFTWQGEGWPGQPMEWQVAEREAEGGEPMARAWTSTLHLDLPRLGSVHAGIQLIGKTVQVTVTGATPASVQELRAAANFLRDRLEASGLQPTSLEFGNE